MRYVVEPAMVAHLWAHQMQDSARNSGGNFYFEGKSIYSYGSHFRCASIVTNKHGKEAFLVTTRTHPNTTAKHMSMVWHAIPFGKQIFYTPRKISLRSGKLYKADYLEGLYYIIDRLKLIDENIKKQMTSRTTDFTNQVEDSLLNIGRWIEFWGLDKRQKSVDDKWLSPAIPVLLKKDKATKQEVWSVSTNHSHYYGTGRQDESHLQDLLKTINELGLIQPTAIGNFEQRVSELFIQWSGDTAIWSKFQERKTRQADTNQKAAETRELSRQLREEQRQHEYEEREKIHRMTQEEKIAKWRSGEIGATRLGLSLNAECNCILRVKDDKVETSMGIIVCSNEAARLWGLMKKFHHNEAEFQRDIVCDSNKHQWSIDSYKNDILTAGCHRIAYPEMENIAKQLGL